MNSSSSNPDRSAPSKSAEVVAVCVSPGGIPKKALPGCEVAADGLAGDGHDHEKHCKPHRAVTLQDLELLDDLRSEGYAVGPGVMGENLTVRGLNVQRLSPGDRLHFQGGPVLELTEERKPCFVLDQIHPKLKEVVVGRCGYLARVMVSGHFAPGQSITVNAPANG